MPSHAHRHSTSPSASPVRRRRRQRPRKAAARPAVDLIDRVDWTGGLVAERRERRLVEELVERLARVDEERSCATSDDERERHRRRLEVVDESTATVERYMQEVRRSLLEQNHLLVDVPGDGSCGIHSVAPAFSAALGRPTSKQEVRELVVNALRADKFRGELEADLRSTNEERRRSGLDELESTDALLDELAQPDEFVPPILLMRATEEYTKGRVRLWAYDTERGAVPFVWSDGDDAIPFACELVHVPAASRASSSQFAPREEQVSGHIARVLPLRSRRRAQEQSFARALDRLSEAQRLNKRMRLALAGGGTTEAAE